jgi:hypothetical protein
MMENTQGTGSKLKGWERCVLMSRFRKGRKYAISMLGLKDLKLNIGCSIPLLSRDDFQSFPVPRPKAVLSQAGVEHY